MLGNLESELPWKQGIGQRNTVVHFSIDREWFNCIKWLNFSEKPEKEVNKKDKIKKRPKRVTVETDEESVVAKTVKFKFKYFLSQLKRK